MTEYIIDSGKYFDILVLTVNREIIKIDFIDKQNKIIPGMIFKGRVKTVSKTRDSALIELGDEQIGFLQDKKQISKTLKSGEEVVVQIKRGYIEEKYPKVTRDIAIPFTSFIFLPFENKIKISNKIKESIDPREIMKNMGIESLEEGGFILRSNFKIENINNLVLEYQEALKNWENIKKNYQNENKPGLIFGMEPSTQFILDSGIKEIHKIISNEKSVLKNLQNSLKNSVKILNLEFKDRQFLLDNLQLEKKIKHLFQSKVVLEDQSNFTIEYTKAFTVIDVNGGSGFKNIDFEKNAFDTNKKTAKSIAGEIMLRDISGVILIDFIDMKSRANQKELLEYMRYLFQMDQKKTTVLSITELGIMQIVRKKEQENIQIRLTQSCDCCDGNGRVPSDKLLLNDIHKEILLQLEQKNYIEVDISSKYEKEIIETLQKLQKVHEFEYKLILH